MKNRHIKIPKMSRTDFEYICYMCQSMQLTIDQVDIATNFLSETNPIFDKELFKLAIENTNFSTIT